MKEAWRNTVYTDISGARGQFSEENSGIFNLILQIADVRRCFPYCRKDNQKKTRIDFRACNESLSHSCLSISPAAPLEVDSFSHEK